jgi:hypothetical protein
MAKINWTNVIDQMQAALVWAVIGIVLVCTIILLAFDSLAGTGINFELTRGNLLVSITISLATTGLFMAIAFLAYIAGQSGYTFANIFLLGVSVLFLAIDTYMDSLGADILHYGVVVIIKNLPPNEQTLHTIYRLLIGGLSTVGEPLALTIIIGLPVLKQIIKKAIPQSAQHYTQPPAQKHFPTSIPRGN